MTFTAGSGGTIKIPAAILNEMGLAPGDHVQEVQQSEQQQVQDSAVQCRQKLRKVQAEHTKAVRELAKWENLTLDSLEGTCVFTPEQIKRRMDTVQETQEKKMIASYLIKAVTLTRDYGIQIEFKVSEAQYLGGMEMG